MSYRTLLLFLLCAVSLSAYAESAIQDPDEWYADRYALLWKERAWEKVEEIAEYYDETIGLHPPDRVVNVVVSSSWLENSIEEWRLHGWVSSIIVDYQSDQLNPTTTLFKVKWLDRYSDGTEEFSCGWYMADLQGDSWAFTQYADMDCTKRDL